MAAGRCSWADVSERRGRAAGGRARGAQRRAASAALELRERRRRVGAVRRVSGMEPSGMESGASFDRPLRMEGDARLDGEEDERAELGRQLVHGDGSTAPVVRDAE